MIVHLMFLISVFCDTVGFSVAIAGTEIVVGAPLALSTLGVTTGAAYSYSRLMNDSSIVWMEMAKFFDDANATGQCFGSSVASTDEGLLLFGAAPMEVMERTDGMFVVNDIELTIAQVFTFIPSSIGHKSSKSDSSSTKVFLVPLVVTMGIVLVSVPIAFLALMVYRKSRDSASVPLKDQEEGGGAPVLRMAPLQDPSMTGEEDVERGHGGESPAGTPQGMGARQKNRRDGMYKELGNSDSSNGSGIWTSLRRVFGPAAVEESRTPQESPVQQPASSSRFDKKNPMKVPPVATV